MTEPFYEEQINIYDGFLYPFSAHLQTNSGNVIMTPAHWHYYIEILYCTSGRAKVFLGGACYSLCAGDLVLMNAREVHSVYGDYAGDTSYIVLKFDPEVLYTAARTVFESKYLLPFTMSNASYQKVFLSQDLQQSPLPNLMFKILDENIERSYGFELAIRTYICTIFLWILRSWHEKGFSFDASQTLKEKDMKRLQLVFDYLDKNFSEDITVESIANLCNMSYSYFSRYFKSVVGRTFTEYLNYVRITESEKLLLTTDLNITEIAMQTGFSTSSYFIQQFKHYKNMSPKQFKKKLITRQDTCSPPTNLIGNLHL